MKLSIKSFMLFSCLCMPGILFGMEQQSKEAQLINLLKKGDAPAIAELLWASTDQPGEFGSLVGLLKSIENEQIKGQIAQAILSKAKNLRPLLFHNLIVQYNVSCRHRLYAPDISPNFRYLCAYAGSYKLYCWDTYSQEIEPCFSVTQNCYSKIFTTDGNYLIYNTDDYVARRTLATADEIRIPIRNKTTVSLLNDRFVFIEPPIIEQNRPGKKNIEILDFEHPDKRRSLSIDDHELMMFCNPCISPDNKFVVLAKGKYLVHLETGKVTILDADKVLSGDRVALFSKDGQFLITNDSHVYGGMITVWNLESDDPKIIMQIPASQAAFCGQSQEYLIFIEQSFGTSNDKKISIVDLHSKNTVFTELIKDYSLSSDGRYIAMAFNTEIGIYDLKLKSYTKRMLFNFPIRNCKISSHGTYVAVDKANNASNQVGVYSVQSGQGLMEFIPGTYEFYFYDNDERYFIIDQASDLLFSKLTHLNLTSSNFTNKSISFFNVATRTFIGSWSPKNNGVFSIHRKGYAPELFLSYCEDTKSFSSLKMADIIAFDRQLNALNDIEKALELALVSEKPDLVLYNRNLLKVWKTSKDKFDSLKVFYFLEKLYAYDACIAYLRAQLDDPSSQAQGEPVKKKKKIESPQDWLTIDQSGLSIDSDSWLLFVKKVRQQHYTISNSIGNIDELFIKYVHLQQAGIVKEMIEIPTQLLKLHEKLKNMIPALLFKNQFRLSPEQSWQKEALEVYFAVLQDLVPKLTQSKIEIPKWQILTEKAKSLKSTIDELDDAIEKYYALPPLYRTPLYLSDELDRYRSSKEVIHRLASGKIAPQQAFNLESLEECLDWVPYLKKELTSEIKKYELIQSCLPSRHKVIPFEETWRFGERGEDDPPLYWWV